MIQLSGGSTQDMALEAEAIGGSLFGGSLWFRILLVRSTGGAGKMFVHTRLSLCSQNSRPVKCTARISAQDAPPEQVSFHLRPSYILPKTLSPKP